MTTSPSTGRSLVTRRAIVDIVRAATLGSYGVTGFAGGPLRPLLARLGLRRPAIRVRLGGRLTIDLDITVANGLPIAEVARQLDSAVRYAIRAGLEREIDRLTIHVDGLRIRPAPAPGQSHADHGAVRPGDLAASGTDVA